MKILAAGSLRLAFLALQPLWEQDFCEPLTMEFGPAGTLRERIESGYTADLYISANREHSQCLVEQGLAQHYQEFVANSLCLTISCKPPFSTASLDTILQYKELCIGMSTPKSDPGGDYACLFFEKLDTIYPGVGTRLQKNAKQLVGGVKTVVPIGENAPSWLIRHGYVDAFIGYTTSALPLQKESDLRVLTIPKAMNIDVRYSLAHLTEKAQCFSSWVTRPKAQEILGAFGFNMN